MISICRGSVSDFKSTEQVEKGHMVPEATGVHGDIIGHGVFTTQQK